MPELNLFELEIIQHHRQSNHIELPEDNAELIAIVDSLYRHTNSLEESSESQLILQLLVQGAFITKHDSVKQHAGSDYERSLQNQLIYIDLQCRESMYQHQLPLDQTDVS